MILRKLLWLLPILMISSANVMAATASIYLGSNWHFNPSPQQTHFQFYINKSTGTRVEQKDLNGTLIYQDFQKMDAKKIKKLIKAAKVKPSDLITIKNKNIEVYAFKIKNNIFWYSNQGGRVVGAFDQFSPSSFKTVARQVEVKL
jgi:hypothetical protein